MVEEFDFEDEYREPACTHEFEYFTENGRTIGKCKRCRHRMVVSEIKRQKQPIRRMELK